MPVLVQAGRSAGPKQGHLFHNPSRRRLWKTLISNFLLWRNYKVDSSAAFVLPSGAILSPDAAWVANQKLQQLTPAQRRRFLAIVPDFIVEVLSPSDRRPAPELKLLEWIASGVSLAWLIDGDARTVTIYRSHLPLKPAPIS